MKELLDGSDLVHDYIEYPIGLRSPRHIAGLRRSIREYAPDLLVYLAEPRGCIRILRDAGFFYACGIRHLIGVPYSRKLQFPYKNNNGTYESESSRLVRCIKRLGDSPESNISSFDLGLSSSEQSQVDLTLGALAGRPLIGMSIGTKFSANDWEDAHWQPFLESLATRYHEYGLLAVGSHDEYTRTQRLILPWENRSLNVCGRMTPRVAAAAIARCRVFIGHDSGPMHLAAAVGTPCVAIFSSRNLPGIWFPLGKHHRVLYRRIECQGCGLENCSKLQKACIRSITMDDALDATADVLNHMS